MTNKILAISSILLILLLAVFVANPSQNAQAHTTVIQAGDEITIKDKVKSQSGMPVVGAVVAIAQDVTTIEDHNGITFPQTETKIYDSDRSSWDGSFDLRVNFIELRKSPNHTYTIFFKAPGGETVKQDVTLEPDQQVNLNVTLTTSLIPMLPFPIFVY